MVGGPYSRGWPPTMNKQASLIELSRMYLEARGGHGKVQLLQRWGEDGGGDEVERVGMIKVCYLYMELSQNKEKIIIHIS